MLEILKWFDGSKPNSELIEVEKNILKFWYVCNPDDETRQDQKINEVLEDICAYSQLCVSEKNPPKTILVNRWNSNNTFTTYFLGVWSEKLISNYSILHWSLLIQLFCTELEKVYNTDSKWENCVFENIIIWPRWPYIFFGQDSIPIIPWSSSDGLLGVPKIDFGRMHIIFFVSI